MTAVSVAWAYHARSLVVFLILAALVVLVARPVFRQVLKAPRDDARTCAEFKSAQVFRGE